MTVSASSFSQAFGTGRGNGTPASEADRLHLYRLEAASAFKAHRAYESGPLRVVVSTQPFGTGNKQYAFLIDNETNQGLAVSYHPDGEARYRMPGIARELYQLCEIPRRYESAEVHAMSSTMRGALVDAGLFTREQLLTEILKLSDRERGFLLAANPGRSAESISSVCRRWGQASALDRGAPSQLSAYGLLRINELNRSMDDRLITLTEDGRFVRHHLLMSQSKRS